MQKTHLLILQGQFLEIWHCVVISQCVIESVHIDFSETFRYGFKATEAGIIFYHSNSGHHKINDQLREIDYDPNFALYDHLKEHLIIVSDWMVGLGEEFIPWLSSKITRRSITGTPLEVFRVQRGQRYRFRFVSSMSHICPAIFDFYDLQPATVESLASTLGERYGFVINANQSEDILWWRIKTVGSCEASQVEQFVMLSYAKPEINSEVLTKSIANFQE
ncbi:CLUMA_CG000110, isoform A [Clunio marinus]|uniref:CLUMA_CG000110, isoform A n=1 Tax=Clunio marinus TaxID=568069 RepID=A0A1J1HG62_9DIPT|nr:CLUMA_CG000110, isoform A [Clunio marinus]